MVGMASRWAVLFLILSWVTTSWADSLTLMQAYDAALKQAPGFQAMIQERKAAQEYRVLGRANLFPTLNYRYSSGENDSTVEQDSVLGPVTDEREYRNYASELRLEQPLFDYRAWASYRVGDARAARAELEFESRLQALAVDVLRAYTDVLLAREQRRLADNRVAMLEALLEQNTRLVDAGEGTRTDALETRSQLALARAEQSQAGDDLALARRRFHSLTGQPDDPAPQPDSPGLQGLSLEQAALESWQAQAINHSPVLAAGREEVRAARGEVERQRAGHLPRVSLYASTRKTDSDSENTYGQSYDTDSYGIQIEVPLFSGGGVSASRRQAAAREAGSEYRLAASRDEVLTAVEEQWRACFGSRERIAALNLAVDSSEQLLEATRMSVLGGERNNQDLLEAERQAHVAQRDLAEARYAYVNAWLALHQQAGVLTSKRIRQVSSALISAKAPLSLSSVDPS